MTFDGRYYNSAPLVGPIHSHPDSPAVGYALSTSLQAAYCYARNANLLIGIQTNAWQFRRDSVYVTTGRQSFFETGYVDVARFRRYRPAHVTHAAFETWFRLFPSKAGAAFHRVKVTDADPTTVTGDASETEHEPPANSPTRRSALHVWDPDHHVFGVSRGIVDLSTINTGEVVEVLVQGYAKHEDSAAMGYRPEITVAWWLSMEAA
jgi:hypothetical protein